MMAQEAGGTKLKLETAKIDDLLLDAKKFSIELVANKLKSTQLRKLHTHVTKLWVKYSTYRVKKPEERQAALNEILEELRFVKAYLVYQQGRKTEGYNSLTPSITALIDQVKDEKTFDKFKKYVDALVAYTRFEEEEHKQDKGK